MKYKAAMFDFDGTITEIGQYFPSQEMVDTLVNLSQVMPIGFCTGRQLESFERNGLNEIIDKMDLSKKDKFLENLYLFGENGAIGYDYNTKEQKFEEIYKVKWPDELIKREDLKTLINKAVVDYGDIYEDAHRVVIVIRTNLHDIDTRDINQVYEYSENIYHIVKDLLFEINPNYEQYLNVGNSGLGVIVGPANGDKDLGIKEFAKVLEDKRNFKFDKEIRDIIVFGDSGHVGGNDHFFLKGDVGTPYSVGEYYSKSGYPKPVIGEDGKRLLNATGTMHFINKNILE